MPLGTGTFSNVMSDEGRVYAPLIVTFWVAVLLLVK
jgi:hypothetical protein